MAAFDRHTLLANFIQLNCSRWHASQSLRGHFNASEIIAIPAPGFTCDRQHNVRQCCPNNDLVKSFYNGCNILFLLVLIDDGQVVIINCSIRF